MKLTDEQIKQIVDSGRPKKSVYINPSAATIGLLIAGILVASAAFVGVFFHAKQYASQNNTVEISK